MGELYLHRLAFDTRALLAFAKEQKLLTRELDDGYLAHAALTAVFGENAPSRFVLEETIETGTSGGHAAPSRRLYAYSRQHGSLLREHSNPEWKHIVRWEHAASKPVPVIRTGTRVACVARVMPVVRSMTAMPGQSKPERGNGKEVDVFLAVCARAGREALVDRVTVYRDWFARELSSRSSAETRIGGAKLEDFSVRAFRRMMVLRKHRVSNEGRPRKVLERPEAIVSATLEVTNADDFRALLARGVGRHRAFGFGMLLLRRIG